MAKANTKTAKQRKVIVESTGEAHVVASFNNIIISLTNKKGVKYRCFIRQQLNAIHPRTPNKAI